MVRLITTAALVTIGSVPVGMIQMHSTFLEALKVGATLGALILMSPFIAGGRRRR